MNKKLSDTINNTNDVNKVGNSTPLVVVIGETASGKSKLAIDLAEKFNGEIICADAWTVRREVNIGTAKPSSSDQARIPHHLLDVVEPCADFTAAVFKGLAQKAIKDISNRGKLPIMVGGTGLYIDGVLFDYGFLPEGDRAKRKPLNKLSVHELNKEVQKAGLSTEGIDTRNKRRLIRLLETGGKTPSKKPLRPNTLIIGLSVPKEELITNIENRVDAMLSAGLEDEVKNLKEKYSWECEALKSIGYREWQAYFEGTQTLNETKQLIIASTKKLAKRQRTWFRRSQYQNLSDPNSADTNNNSPKQTPHANISNKSNKGIHWVNNRGNAVEITTTFLSNFTI